MRTLLIVLSVAVCSATVFAQQPAATVQAGDAAFDRGNQQEALRLYEAVLANDPNNVQALVRTGMLLSWQNKFDAALERYARVLKIEPKHPKARLERAKVLSWAKRYPQAAAAFKEILADDPNNIDALLGVARVTSWSGNQSGARAAYLRILERNPENMEATLGVAQTYAWSGQESTAREWYGRVLTTQPDRREAILGTAYLDLSGGDRVQAAQKTVQLEQRFPDDKEVRELRSAVNRAGSPLFRLSSARIDDTDDNRVGTVAADATFSLPRRSDLMVGYERYQLEDISGLDGTIQAGFLALALRPSPSQRIGIRAGVEQSKRTDGTSVNDPIGRLSWAIGVGSRFTATAAAERRSFHYTTTSLDAGLRFDAYSLIMDARPGPFRVNFGGAHWSLSDGNRRNSGDAALAYQFPITRVRVSTGYRFHYVDYEQNLSNGYFDPQNFRSHALGLDLSKSFARAYVQGGVERGMQSFDLGDLRIRDDSFLAWNAMLGVRITPGMSLEIGGGSSDSALNNPAGFESSEIFARLRVQNGR